MRASYTIVAKVGKYNFTKAFETEIEALECFDSIALVTDGQIEDNVMSQIANAVVEEVTIIRHVKPETIGDPNRR